MQKLLAGLRQFQREHAARYGSVFAQLSRQGQNPHTLLVTCSDSRVVASLLTQSQPGDLFIVKNIGNIVPPADTPTGSHSVAAAIEYAVSVLRVVDIVVCGHTQCGAMQALLEGLPTHAPLPHLRAWLVLAEAIRDRLPPDAADKLTVAAEENVRLALRNLTTYPCVAQRMADGELRIHGWMFCVATAEMFALDPVSQQFHPLIP